MGHWTVIHPATRCLPRNVCGAWRVDGCSFVSRDFHLCLHARNQVRHVPQRPRLYRELHRVDPTYSIRFSDGTGALELTAGAEIHLRSDALPASVRTTRTSVYAEHPCIGIAAALQQTWARCRRSWKRWNLGPTSHFSRTLPRGASIFMRSCDTSHTANSVPPWRTSIQSRSSMDIFWYRCVLRESIILFAGCYGADTAAFQSLCLVPALRPGF